VTDSQPVIPSRHKLLLATNNQGKITEYRSLFQELPVVLVTPAELGINTKVHEVGSSFKENARLKAVVLARESGLIAMADDSGMEVDALGGEPGVMSARFAGAGASDNDRISTLLAKMADVPWERRGARFNCVIAIATPGGNIEYCPGKCRGFITLAPQGEYGFGYDPVFWLPELNKTMAELPLEAKNRVSHRGQAAMKARPIIQRMVK